MTAGTALLVVLAGAVGAVARADVAALGRRRGWPPGLATGLVNVLGAAALGVVVATTTGNLRTVLGGGLLGAFTTFSTWMVEAIDPSGQASDGGRATTLGGETRDGPTLTHARRRGVRGRAVLAAVTVPLALGTAVTALARWVAA